MGLDSQEFNPEVVVPQIADAALKEKADMLDQIQQVSGQGVPIQRPARAGLGWRVGEVALRDGVWVLGGIDAGSVGKG